MVDGIFEKCNIYYLTDIQLEESKLATVVELSVVLF